MGAPADQRWRSFFLLDGGRDAEKFFDECGRGFADPWREHAPDREDGRGTETPIPHAEPDTEDLR